MDYVSFFEKRRDLSNLRVYFVWVNLMELSFLLAKEILSLFIIVIVGCLLIKTHLLTSDDGKVISKLVLYVVCPCTILNAFQIELTQDKLTGLMLSFLGAILVHIVYLILTKLLSSVFHFMPVEKASLIYTNAGNLVIPLVSAVLGPEWVFYTSGYIVIQTILLWTHGKNTVCNEKTYDIKKIILNINVIAIFIGIVLFLSRIQLPDILLTTVSSIGSMVGPLSMLVIGMLIGHMNFKDILEEKRTYLICILRLIVYPLVMIVIFHLSGMMQLHPYAYEILMITILAAAAPAAATITQFAQLYNKHPGYTSLINVMSVVMCIVTMPLMIMIYEIFLKLIFMS